MTLYRLFLIVSLLIFSGCSRDGDDKKKSDNNESIAVSSTTKSGGKATFEIISTSDTLHDESGNFRDRGHYSMIFQAKRKKDSHPIDALSKSAFYTMYENGEAITESKIRISQDSKTVSNKIMLLLDFSGSIVRDCEEDNATTSAQNLCYQIVNSSKQFIDKTVSKHQMMAIYYFNSQRKILPLSGDPSYETSLLKSSLDKLYSKEWRDQYLAGYDSTNLYGAIKDATEVLCHWFQDCEVGKSSQINSVDTQNYDFATMVVFTDGRHTAGNSNTKKSEMLHVLPLYKRNYYYTIGLGDVDDEILKTIGTSGYLKATQTNKLDDEFNKLGEQLNAFANSFYKLDYCPAQQGGLLDLRLDVKDTARGYEGKITNQVQLLDEIDFRCDL